MYRRGPSVENISPLCFMLSSELPKGGLGKAETFWLAECVCCGRARVAGGLFQANP